MPMNPLDDQVISRPGAFGWVAIWTGVALLIPAAAMQFTSEVNWSGVDFLVMGALLLVAGSSFVVAARRVPRNRRAALGVLFATALVFVWAELAVGVFTDLGS